MLIKNTYILTTYNVLDLVLNTEDSSKQDKTFYLYNFLRKFLIFNSLVCIFIVWHYNTTNNLDIKLRYSYINS